ncbi:hypothetical protein L7F22_021927 [Adiantum nelumboides]|nr:hypothetical protein [Adiantum nelumboides]
MQQAPPVQILRPLQQQQPPLPPASIPPLLPVPENRTVSIITLDAKEKAKVEEEELSLPMVKGNGKEKKQEEVDAMPIKRARQEQTTDSEANTRRKTKESAESSKKKKKKPRQNLTIKDLALGESSQPYDLVDDVSMQGPKISWPQLLFLSPKVCRQWSKMVSTRRVKTKAMGLVSRRSLKDIVPVVDAYVKGQCISNVYVDGGAQICVMSEHVFHCLGLKISAPAPYKAKMANNVKVKCLGIVNGVKVKVCEVEVEVDVYVMTTKGEGYAIILGKLWLMAMQARQDWGTGMLELSPHKGSGKKTKVVRYDMKTGKQGKMKFETSSDEFSSSIYSTITEEESTTSDENIPRVEESKLAKMLAKDLTKEQKQAYLTMLKDFPTRFIEGYDQIIGNNVVQHHINLKEETILPIEVQSTSLRVPASGRETPKEQLQQRILDLERLELDSAIEFYARQVEKRRQKFNEGLKDKELKRGMLVLRYDNHFDNKKDKKFLSRWEGPFLIRKKYSNGSYQLQKINGRLHKTRLNGWRLKPYFQRFDSKLSFQILYSDSRFVTGSSSGLYWFWLETVFQDWLLVNLYNWLVSGLVTDLVSCLVQFWLLLSGQSLVTGSGPLAGTQGSATQDPHIAASDSSSDFDVMKGYPMQQHPKSSSQDTHALGQQPGISMFSRLKETLSRATRSEHATNEINEGGGEVDSPLTSQIDPVLSESAHVSTPATTPIGLSKLTPSETLLPDGRSLAEVQEVERYILAAREKEIESLRKAEQRRATLAKAPMTSANPLQSPELTTLKSQPIGSCHKI